MSEKIYDAIDYTNSLVVSFLASDAASFDGGVFESSGAYTSEDFDRLKDAVTMVCADYNLEVEAADYYADNVRVVLKPSPYSVTDSAKIIDSLSENFLSSEAASFEGGYFSQSGDFSPEEVEDFESTVYETASAYDLDITDLYLDDAEVSVTLTPKN